MAAERELIAFVGVADLAAVRDFYLDVLGLTLEADTPYALVLRSGGVMVRVTPVPGHTPSGGTALGWGVPDIVGEAHRLAARGVSFERYEGMTQDDAGIWTAPDGGRVCWFKDPAGNVLSLTQFP